ncbi:MAG: VWA domain-containing protein, partial [Phycisphaerae bacterium]
MRSRAAAVFGLTAVLLAGPALAYTPGPSRTPTGLQTAKPPLEEDGNPAKEPAADAGARKLFDFLVREYDNLLTKAKDRVGRSLVIICISRVPREDVTNRLFELLEAERDPLVKVVAWEAVLARAKHLTNEQHQRFVLITALLGKGDLFRGELRLPAAQVLKTGIPDINTKAAWQAMFSSADPAHDAAALTALGECANHWRAPDVVEFVVRKAGTHVTEGARAAVVFKALGSTGPDAATASSLKQFAADHQKWWTGAKLTWKPITGYDNDTRATALAPHYLPPPAELDSVNATDKTWYRDLELRAPNLRNFDVGFCVDVTGSMGNAITWLKADVAKMMLAFGTVATEPRIGITFYKDKGDDFVAQTHPLTNRVEDLLKALGNMTADGGGDAPEAVLEGLQDCFRNNRWSQSQTARKAVILIADAPPHAESQAACVQLARQSAEKGFKIYAVKCQSDPDALPELEAIAEASKGMSISVGLNELAAGRGRGAAADMAAVVGGIEAARGGGGPVRVMPDGTVIGPDGRP